MECLDPLLILLAQGGTANVDPITGASGWVGAGLLGLVLAWLLFKHLPAKDQQIKDLVAEKDAHIERVLTKKDEEMVKALAAKDAQFTEVLASKNDQVKQISAYYEALLKDIVLQFRAETTLMRDDFKISLKNIVDHCRDETTRIVEALRSIEERRP